MLVNSMLLAVLATILSQSGVSALPHRLPMPIAMQLEKTTNNNNNINSAVYAYRSAPHHQWSRRADASADYSTEEGEDVSTEQFAQALQAGLVARDPNPSPDGFIPASEAISYLVALDPNTGEEIQQGDQGQDQDQGQGQDQSQGGDDQSAQDGGNGDGAEAGDGDGGDGGDGQGDGQGGEAQDGGDDSQGPVSDTATTAGAAGSAGDAMLAADPAGASASDPPTGLITAPANPSATSGPSHQGPMTTNFGLSSLPSAVMQGSYSGAAYGGMNKEKAPPPSSSSGAAKRGVDMTGWWHNGNEKGGVGVGVAMGLMGGVVLALL